MLPSAHQTTELNLDLFELFQRAVAWKREVIGAADSHSKNMRSIYIQSYKEMAQIIEKLGDIKHKIFGKKHKLELLSENWEKSLGEFCSFCQTRLREEQCISICKCLLFCHEECFIKQISPYLSTKSEVKCKRCDQYVNFTMNITTLWVCNKRPTYVLSVLGSILFMIGLYLIIADGVYRPYVSDTISYSILSLIALLLVYAIIRSSRRKITRLQDIKVVDTNMLSKGETQKGLMEKDMSEAKAEGKSKLSVTVSRVELAEYQNL